MEIIGRLEEYLGYDLTNDTVRLLARAPAEHIVALLTEIAPYYYGWLEREEGRDVHPSEGPCICLDWQPRDDWQQQVEDFKRQLLYLPRCVLPDPLAACAWPVITMASVTREMVITDEFRRDLEGALSALAWLVPLRQEAAITLIPYPFVGDDVSVQEATHFELTELDKRDSVQEYHRAVAQALAVPGGSPTAMAVRSVVEKVKLNGVLCSRLGYTPLAGTRAVHEALRYEYTLAGSMQSVGRASGITHHAIQSLQYAKFPGLKACDLETVLALRRNEDGFREFRNSFGLLLDQAQRESPQDDQQWSAEFQQAADDLIRPRMDDLNRLASSSIMERFVVPAALSLGAGAVTYLVTDPHTFPIPPAAAAGLGPISWVADKLRKRFSKAGRKVHILREAYGLLIPKDA